MLATSSSQKVAGPWIADIAAALVVDDIAGRTPSTNTTIVELSVGIDVPLPGSASAPIRKFARRRRDELTPARRVDV